VANPLRSEDAAFRLVGWTIAYLAPIALASLLSTWLGLAVFLAETAALGWVLTRSRRRN
jgi:hypothetical protein